MEGVVPYRRSRAGVGHNESKAFGDRNNHILAQNVLQAVRVIDIKEAPITGELGPTDDRHTGSQRCLMPLLLSI